MLRFFAHQSRYCLFWLAICGAFCAPATPRNSNDQFPVVETIEGLLGFVGKRIDAFSRNSLRVDVASGLAAALSLTTLVALLDSASNSPTEYDRQRNISLLLSCVLLCTACYLTPVVILYLTRLRLLKRFIPSCVMIAVFGSLLLICSIAGHDVAKSLLRSDLPLSKALGERLWDGLGALAGLSILMLPVTCVVHYAGAIARAIDRWHNGASNIPSVVE